MDVGEGMAAGEPERLPRRWYAVAAGVVALAAAVAALIWALSQERSLTGTNSVAPRYSIGQTGPGQQFCQGGLQVPGNTNAVTMRLQGPGPPAVVTLRFDAAGRAQTSRRELRGTDFFDTDFPLTATGANVVGRVCITGSRPVNVAGQTEGVSPANATLDGKPTSGKAMVLLRRLPARGLVSALPDGTKHAALFRPGFVGAWTYFVLGAIVVLLWVAAGRLLWRSL
jgi:hypothetical protein